MEKKPRERLRWTESEKCVGLSAPAGRLEGHRREFITGDKLYCSVSSLFFVSVSESGGRAALAKGPQIYMMHYEVHEICGRIMGKYVFL